MSVNVGSTQGGVIAYCVGSLAAGSASLGVGVHILILAVNIAAIEERCFERIPFGEVGTGFDLGAIRRVVVEAFKCAGSGHRA